MGQHGSTDFSFISEVNWSLGYQVTSCIRLLVGYNLIYWNHVERPGNQIDRRIDFVQSPTNTAPPVPATNPVFPNQRTDFWAQGINLGIEIKY